VLYIFTETTSSPHIPIILFLKGGLLYMSNLTNIEDRQIAEVLANSGLTVLLMTAPWDGNGIIMRRIMEGFVPRFRSVSFLEADYESCPRLARLFNLMSPPGILFVKDGEMVNRVSGPVSARRINELIQAAVG